MLELTLWSINGSPVSREHRVAVSSSSVLAVRDVSVYGHPMKSEITVSILDMRYSDDDMQVTNFNVVYEVKDKYEDIIRRLEKDGWK